MKALVTVRGSEYVVYLYSDNNGPRRIVVAGYVKRNGTKFLRKIADVYRMKDLKGAAKDAASLAGARLAA